MEEEPEEDTEEEEEEEKEQEEEDSDAESEVISLPYIAQVHANRMGYQGPKPR